MGIQERPEVLKSLWDCEHSDSYCILGFYQFHYIMSEQYLFWTFHPKYSLAWTWKIWFPKRSLSLIVLTKQHKVHSASLGFYFPWGKKKELWVFYCTNCTCSWYKTGNYRWAERRNEDCVSSLAVRSQGWAGRRDHWQSHEQRGRGYIKKSPGEGQVDGPEDMAMGFQSRMQSSLRPRRGEKVEDPSWGVIFFVFLKGKYRTDPARETKCPHL